MRVFSAIAIWVLLLPMMIQAAVFIDFQIRRAEIARTTCVNKENNLKCRGTCQLVKAIKKEVPEKENDPYTPDSSKEKKEVQWFFQEMDFIFAGWPEHTGMSAYTDDSGKPVKYHPAVFHPPKTT